MKRSLPFVAFLLTHAIGYSQSPGGISTGMKLWVKANAGVTASGSTVTAWTDQAGVNSFAVTGSPQLAAEAINFNPAVTFDGSSRFTGNTSIANTTEILAVSKIVNGSPVVTSGAVLGTVGASNYAYSFHTEGGTLYGSGSSAGIYYGTTSFGNNIPWSVLDGDLSETPAASQQMKVNGIAYANSAGGDPAVYSGTPVIGARSTENLLSGSQVAEVVAYNASQAGTNRSRIISYLALKYGLTLGNTSSAISYLASDGTTFWTANSAYQTNVAGLGKDASSGLEQQISASQDPAGDIITLSTDNNFTGANGTHTAIASDKFFFVAGNNNAAAAYAVKSGLANGLNAIMKRVWLVQQSGTAQNVFISTTNKLATYLIYSTDATFSTGVNYVALTGGATTGIQIPGGSYFTLATYLKSPGGVTGSQLWLEANNFSASTADNTAISAWPDISGAGNDATGYNSPAFRAGSNSTYALNFNPAMAFNGSNQYFQAANGFANFTSGMSLFTVHQYATASSWARIIDFGNGAAADNVVFARNATNTYYTGAPYNGGTALTTISTAANTVYTNAYGLANWNFAAGAVGATVSSTVNLKGYTNVTANTGVPSNTARTLNYIGRSNWADTYFQGYMPELILYNRQLSAAEQLQVHAYLALKYGFTLNTPAGAASNYVASDGTTVFWNATANIGYTKNVFGLGKDYLSSLEQQISASQENSGDIITLSTDNNFTGANGTHTAIANDKFFFLVGNNGSPVSYRSQAGLANQLNLVMSRSWKVQQTGTAQTVYLSTSNSMATYLVYSTDSTFSGGVSYIALSGGVASGIQAIPTGSYFTFATYMRAPGGVVAPTANGGYVNGVQYSLYGTNTNYPATGMSGTVLSTGYANSFNGSNTPALAGSEITTYYGIQFISSLKISAAGSYSFELKRVDDNGALYIDGNLVASTTGLGETDNVVGSTVSLSAGYHTIQLNYNQSTGGSVIEVQYQGPDNSNTMADIPDAVLFVSPSIASWYKANGKITATGDGTTPTAWADETANANNTAASSGTATYYSTTAAQLLNFNPAVNNTNRIFAGNDQSAGLAWGAQGRTTFTATSGTSSTGSNLVIYDQGRYVAYNTYNTESNAQNAAVDFYGLSSTGSGTPFSNASSCVLARTTVSNYNLIGTNNVSGYVHGLSNYTATQTAFFTELDATADYGLGYMADGTGQNFPGRIAEVINYPWPLSATESNKVETYLSIKYGTTLGTTASLVNYTSTAGTTVWTGNATYQNNIIGLARDTAEGLEQRISASQMPAGDIITLSTDNSFTGANSTHAAIAADQFYFMVGNNGATTVYTAKTGLSNGINAIMNRVWLVQQSGTAQNVFILTTNKQAGYLIYSTDATFSTGVSYAALTNGATGGIQIPSGNYFTLAAFIVAPGGVVNNLNAWFLSDSVSTVTVSGSNVSAWANSTNPGFTCNLTNPNYSYGYVTYSSSSNLVNFNPGIYQNGSQTYGYGLYNNTTNVLTGLTAAAATGSSYSFITVGKDMVGTAGTLRSSLGNGNAGNDPAMDIQKDGNSANGLNYYTDGITGTGGTGALGNYHAAEWYYGPAAYDAAPAANAQSNATAYNNGGAGVLDYANAANLPTAYTSRLANQQPQIYGANYTHSLTTGNPINAWVDGYKQNTYLTPGSGSVYMTYPELTIGNSGGGENWVGPINEVIAYNRELTDAEMQKVNTYLAIKYGVTLGQGGSTASGYKVGCDSNSYNYVSSAGTVIWNPVTNIGYNWDIVGIGRDDASGLQQKVSQSANYGDVVTMATSSDFSSTNRTSGRTTIGSDQSFFLVGNNGASATMLQYTDVDLTQYRARVSRIWKAQTTNFSQTINLQFAGWGTNTYRTVYLIKSTTGSFATGSTQVTTLNASGQANGISLNNGDYFTLAVVQIAPGGVLPGLQLWNEANSFAAGTSDGTAITTTWADISGNAKDPVAYNSPLYRSGANSTYAANYNPAIAFNGTNQYFKAASGFSDFTAGISMFSVHQYTSSSSWARIMDFGNGTNADNLLFARYSTTATYAAETYNGSTQSAILTTTGTPAVYTNLYGLVSWIQTGGAAAAVANDTIYMKGIRNATSGSLKVPNMISRTSNYIGLSNWPADTYFQGYVPELVLYNRQLRALEQLRVNSYLALKYGFTLGSTSNVVSYTASDSTTVFWTGSGTYQNNVFGIGRDDQSGLSQVISKSSETGDIVTLALDNNFSAANNDATRTTAFAGDKTFLMAGNDGGSVSASQTTGLPLAFCGNRLPRNWKIQRTNTVGSVNVQVNIGTVLGASLVAGNIVLLIDQDGDGNFTTGTQTAVYATSYSGGIAVFNGVNFDSDNSGTDVFTIASRSFVPMLIALGNSATATAYCSSGSYNHYKNPADATKSVVAFNPNGNSFAPTTVTVANLNSLTATGVTNAGSYYQQTSGTSTFRVANRFNSVVAPGSYTTGGGITVRVYYAAADTMAMVSDAFPAGTLGDRGWYKSTSSTAAGVVSNMQSGTLLNAIKVSPVAYGTENGINYVEFQVTSFSTFGFYASNSSIVLSVTLKYFQGYASGCSAMLTWEAALEENTDHYEVEYSTDGKNFQPVGDVAAQGAGHVYAFTYKPDLSLGYYRLKMVDRNGHFSYSYVIPVDTRCDESKLVLAPNPAHDKVFVMAGSRKITDASLIDVSGRTIRKVKDQLTGGVDISGLAQGLYYIQVMEADGNMETLKFLKE